MFRNRSFLVKPVKDDGMNVILSPPPDYHEIAKVVTKSVSTCIGVYVGMDILRRVVVYAVTAKL
jgi:hypothetical protein